MISIPLMKEQHTEVPATYQLASYLERKQEPFIVYTWEETRVMEYLQMPYEHKRFYIFIFLQDKNIIKMRMYMLPIISLKDFKTRNSYRRTS